MKRKSSLFLITLLILFCVISKESISAEAIEKPILQVTAYEVTNGTITPGEDFTLSVHIKNFGSVSAENVIVTFSNPNNVVPEYGTVTNTFFERMIPNSEEIVSFKYSANSEMKETEVNFVVSVESDESGYGVQIRVPVGRTTDFEVNEKVIPNKLNVEKLGYLSAQVENISTKGVTNASLVARVAGVDISSSPIGSIPAKTFKTQYVSVSFDEPGRQTVDLVLTYTNNAGEDREFLISSSIISVEEEIKVETDYNFDISNNDYSSLEPINNQNQGQSRVLILSVSGVLFIGICCIILLIVYRRKK